MGDLSIGGSYNVGGVGGSDSSFPSSIFQDLREALTLMSGHGWANGANVTQAQKDVQAALQAFFAYQKSNPNDPHLQNAAQAIQDVMQFVSLFHNNQNPDNAFFPAGGSWPTTISQSQQDDLVANMLNAIIVNFHTATFPATYPNRGDATDPGGPPDGFVVAVLAAAATVYGSTGNSGMCSQLLDTYVNGWFGPPAVETQTVKTALSDFQTMINTLGTDPNQPSACIAALEKLL